MGNYNDLIASKIMGWKLKSRFSIDGEEIDLEKVNEGKDLLTYCWCDSSNKPICYRDMFNPVRNKNQLDYIKEKLSIDNLIFFCMNGTTKIIIKSNGKTYKALDKDISKAFYFALLKITKNYN